jgi:hypothetical protein
MCAAVRTEQKYSIPRNPIIRELTALDILASGSLFKSRDGAAEGYALPLFRADGDAGATFSMQNRGVLYYFKYGHIYVTDAAKTTAQRLMEGVSLTSAFVLPGVAEMAGGLSAIVEKGGDMLIEAVTEKATHKPAAKVTYGEQIAILERQGMIALPGVDLVEAEYQVEPAGFMSKERHIQIFTYVDASNRMYRYQFGAPMKGSKASESKTMLEIPLTARKWAELQAVISMVTKEFAPGFDAVRAEMCDAFEQKHGAGSAYRSEEFVKDLNARYEAETKRNGFNTQVCAQRSLELLEPMREIYDRTPVLQGMMQELRTLAAGAAT